MKHFTKYILYCIGLVLILGCLYFLAIREYNFNTFLSVLGLAFLFSIPFSFLGGVACIFHKDSRILGGALLTYSAIALLLGLGICSQVSIHIH